MELTRQQALELTASMWDELAENADKEKIDWSGWTMLLPSDSILNHCFLCEYTWQEEESEDSYPKFQHCTICPLKDLWNEDDMRVEDAICESFGTIYRDWVTSEGEQRMAAAKRIADLCRQVLVEEE